jgi:16S rRNA (adenine1518-N6/adenine1519-N6)-dimethyltransferase
VVDKIVESVGEVSSVLEIGPGPGVLTSALASKYQNVVALEIDERMISVLSESSPSADVRQIDALKSDLNDILRELSMERAIVSNLPYYITGPLLGRIEEARTEFSHAVLMMQKEVGERILAPPGDSKRGSLSVCLQYHFLITKVADAAPGCFWPPPKVKSIVLKFVPRDTEGLQSSAFPTFVRQGFQQPRKTLANNLSSVFDKVSVSNAIVSLQLSETVRPHMLSEVDWLCLFDILQISKVK